MMIEAGAIRRYCTPPRARVDRPARRAEVGNAWMRENMVPHAAAPPDRIVGKAVVSFERS